MNIEKEVKLLKLYTSLNFAVITLFILVYLSPQVNSTKFQEIDVERINVVEKDGQLRMVISNKERQHPGISNGKVIERTYPRPPGMIFFNQHGDEMGGFVFGENGEKGHFGQLSLDKVQNDQTIGFRYIEGDNGTYTAGMQVWQQPNIPSDSMLALIDEARKIDDEEERSEAFRKLREEGLITTERLFVGKGRDENSMLALHDIQGRPRLVISVEAEGDSKIEFWDENGVVVRSLP